MDFDVVKATVLAFIQGLTEFLPISSSAHLIFPSALFGWEDQGLAFDVAVHLGTLLAVVIYFRRDLLNLFSAWLANVTGRERSRDSDLAWLIILATVPVVIAGLLLQDVVAGLLRNVTVIAITTVLFAFPMWYADAKSTGTKGLHELTWKSSLFIGLAQVLALVPGTSRSGITMTAALLCNLDRESSSRFSFLISIPVIAGAALLLTLDLLQRGEVDWSELVYAMILSGVVAFFCIHYFLKAIESIGFFPFVIYRFILGAVLFLFFTPFGLA